MPAKGVLMQTEHQIKTEREMMLGEMDKKARREMAVAPYEMATAGQVTTGK